MKRAEDEESISGGDGGGDGGGGGGGMWHQCRYPKDGVH